MENTRLTGAMTALVTPFRDGHLDEPALARLVEEQIAAGIDGLVPCGTTGESPTLELDEHKRVVEIVVQTAKKRVPVIAGAGSNSTAHAIALAKASRDAGADALLVVTPYYNKPTQEGLIRHFRAVCDAADLPIVAYNVPGRCVVDFSVDSLAKLAAAEPRVVAIKEATSSVQRSQEIVRRLGDRMIVLSGEDAINLPIYAVGGRGCISVTSNVMPKLVADCWDAAAANDYARARALHARTLEVTELLFVEGNPTGAKAALATMGRISGEIRPPLYPLSDGNRDRLRAALAKEGLL